MARPTPWLFREFADELFDAALRGVDNACRLLTVAALNNVDGYDLDTLIKRLGKDPAVLSTAVEDSAFLVQGAEPDAPRLTVAAQLWTLLLDADRTKTPPQVLTCLGRWAFVDNIDDQEWAQLTLRTLDATDGQIQYPISVVDRVARIPPDGTSRSILLRLVDSGEPWERHHAATKALDVLHASTAQSGDESYRRLRTRLIDLGYHGAADM